MTISAKSFRSAVDLLAHLMQHLGAVGTHVGQVAAGDLAGSPSKAGTFAVVLTVTGADKKSVSIKQSIVVQDGDLAAKPADGGDAKGGKPAPDSAKPPKPADE